MLLRRRQVESRPVAARKALDRDAHFLAFQAGREAEAQDDDVGPPRRVGRLPVTFYRDVADLPPFDDYRMAGRTYRFFEGAPLYPFGYGLSYATFRYDRLRISSDTLRGGDTVDVSVDITNTGARGGDEVVQLYVRYPSSRVARPKRDLRGFRRVTLQPTEKRTVTFPLAGAALRYWDPGGHRWGIENGPVVVEAGASSADIRLTTTLVVTGQR